jgi:predicted short-subunit dehydrogenase-like oxidoreductase (DUF2520 family)
MSFNICIIGSGNLAKQLFLIFKEKGHTISGLAARNVQVFQSWPHVNEISVFLLPDLPKEADFYFICTSDDSIAILSKQIESSNSIVVHCAGSIAIQDLGKQHRNKAVFYPLQSFSDNQQTNFETIPLCLDASNESTKKKLLDLAQTISNQIFWFEDEQRKKIHLMAVILNNFINYLLIETEQIATKEKISLDLFKPLLELTLQKSFSLGAKKSQTGPAKRGDLQTIANHKRLLESIHPDFLPVYQLLSEKIKSIFE